MINLFKMQRFFGIFKRQVYKQRLETIQDEKSEILNQIFELKATFDQKFGKY